MLKYLAISLRSHSILSVFLFAALYLPGATGVAAAAPSGTVLVPADDKGINYYGRFDTADPKQPRFNWSGAIIEASFPGPVIGMKMQHTDAFYDIEIDGAVDTMISCGSATDFIFRNDLSTGVHTVRIMLRSEQHWGAGTFSGLYIDAGKELAPPPVMPSRIIEFIGDSHTAGYGIESDNRSCGNLLNRYTNANKTFAALIPRAFHARSTILGWSGAGMVRNYGESTKRSDSPYSVYYDKTLGGMSDSPTWDFSKDIPELVVINLGTNDYSTPPIPDDSMYIGDYHKLIARVLGHYPDASILCISSGDATLERNVKKVVAEEQTSLGHPKIYFAPYPSGLSFNGCDWHPNIDDNVKMTTTFVDTILKNLGWDTATTIVQPLARTSGCNRSAALLTPAITGNTLHITASQSVQPGTAMLLSDLSGRVIAAQRLANDRTCRFTLNRVQPGIYFTGSSRYGWIKTPVR